MTARPTSELPVRALPMDEEARFANRTGEIRITSEEQLTVAPALVSRDGTWLRAKYVETADGMAGARATVAMTMGADPQVLVVRTGAVRARYAFRAERVTRGGYELAEGRLDMEITTARLEVRVTEGRAVAEIDAQIAFAPGCSERRRILIDLTWRSHPRL